jgi:hypothetical protein
MAKRKVELAEPTEELLGGVLDRLEVARPTVVADIPAVGFADGSGASTGEGEQSVGCGAVPPINSADWTPFIMSKLTQDEVHDGCPTYQGLERLCYEYLGDIVDIDIDPRQAPNVHNGNHTCLVARITIDHPPEFDWLGRIAGRTIRYSHVGDTFNGNGGRKDSFAWQFSSATCATRAKASLLRGAFRLRHVYAKEELSGLSPGESGADAYIIVTQVDGLDMMCSRLNVNVTKFLMQTWKHYVKDQKGEDLNFIPYWVVQKSFAQLQPWQHDKSTIPAGVLGYDPDWKNGLKCLA